MRSRREDMAEGTRADHHCQVIGGFDRVPLGILTQRLAAAAFRGARPGLLPTRAEPSASRRRSGYAACAGQRPRAPRGVWYRAPAGSHEPPRQARWPAPLQTVDVDDELADQVVSPDYAAVLAQRLHQEAHSPRSRPESSRAAGTLRRGVRSVSRRISPPPARPGVTFSRRQPALSRLG